MAEDVENSDPKEKPLKRPKTKKISDDELSHRAKEDGGFGGTDLDVPAFLREQQRDPSNLPIHPVIDTPSKN